MLPESSCLLTTTWNTEVDPPDLAATPVTQLIGGTSYPRKSLKNSNFFCRILSTRKKLLVVTPDVRGIIFFTANGSKCAAHPLTVRNSMNRHKRFFILRPGKRLSGDSGRHQMVHKQLHSFRLFRRKLLRSVNVYFRQACRKYTEFVGEGGNPERVLADSKSDRSIEHLIHQQGQRRGCTYWPKDGGFRSFRSDEP